MIDEGLDEFKEEFAELKSEVREMVQLKKDFKELVGASH